MRKYFVLLLIVALINSCANKKVLNQLKFDEKANQEILYGYCNEKGLQTAPFNEWFDMEYSDYQPEMDIIGKIENSGGISEISITIVMGTWCSDSRREVPRFFKILNILNYDANRVKLIMVDRKKEAEGTIVSKLNIERVPTFIFTKGKTEVGRIIETPEVSLEGDLLKIIENL